MKSVLFALLAVLGLIAFHLERGVFGTAFSLRQEASMSRQLLLMLMFVLQGVRTDAPPAVQNPNSVTAVGFVIDPPTLINLGFEWFIQGGNPDGSVASGPDIPDGPKYPPREFWDRRPVAIDFYNNYITN